MSPLRIGVLGAANIARKSTIPAILATPDVEFAGIAARDLQRAKDLVAEFGGQAFQTYQDVLEDDSIDAVYLPLPISLHKPWALAAISAGKHVLVEKSLAGNLDDARAIITAARAAQVTLLENFMCETHPQSLWLRERIADGDLGDLRHIELSFGFPPFPRDDLRNSRELQGGALNDAGAYCLDMARFYIGRLPQAIAAKSDQLDYDVDVIGSALLDFSEGLTASVSYGFSHDYRNQIHVWGTKGQVTIDRAFSIPATRNPNVCITHNAHTQRIDLPATDQFRTQLLRFRHLCSNSVESRAVLDQLEAHACLMQAARDSAAGNRWYSLADYELSAVIS